MSREDLVKAELIDNAVGLARARMPGNRAALADALIRAFYANVADDDVLKRDPETLYGAAAALMGLARRRSRGELAMRVYNPRLEENGWASDHTVIEMVNDDMPFLVDSITAELMRQEIDIHLVAHPIVATERDRDGVLQAIVPVGQGGALESLIHIEIDRRTDPAALERIARRLGLVLTDVRAAVGDWQAMRKTAGQVAEALTAPPPAIDAGEAAEARDFLAWLHDDHFTFLGYRAFTFDPAQDGAAVLDRESGLGVMRDPTVRMFDEGRDLGAMSPEVGLFLRQPNLLLITKSDRASTIHRAVPMDIIGVKRLSPTGEVIGLHAFIGLFGSTAYTYPPAMIPVLRRKVARAVERAGFLPSSHDGKTLLHILESYPRDELWQISDDALHATAIGILRLQERQRVAVFLRSDEFKRFISALVFVPRDRYDTRLRQEAQRILEQTFAGKVSDFFTHVGNNPLARVHFIVHTPAGAPREWDHAELEERIAEAARSWADRLQAALTESHGEELGLALMRRYAPGFPPAYRESTGVRAAAQDIARIEELAEGADLVLNLHRPLEAGETEARFKIYHPSRPVTLSDMLPVLENLGFRVISEVPHHVACRQPEGGAWIHEFTIETADDRPVDVGRLRESFHEAFARVWRGDAENDGFNRLVVTAGLAWREVMVLRAYAKYLRQAGITFSQSYRHDALARNPAVARLLVRLFHGLFDPQAPAGRADEALAALLQVLEGVELVDDDRILRRFLNLVRGTLRTNYYQAGADGRPKPYLALKLDSRAVDELPLPRPLVEIFVYATTVEAIHLRGGKVARGGIRWSDRREDFRTEILGLMKAQMVKNAVIVPVGAKGGFVVKRPPAGREALQEEGKACYRTLIRGLLDLTDTIAGNTIVPPADVVRRDGDDPYLVVAADKGTATFSDMANALSLDYGFWLGDAFASGGSNGYDHKAMAITARGAWESVKRHFRELGRDIQSSALTVVGVGDMAGDVFGNGMLRSRHIKLVAAFNHSHVLLDPDPDPEISFSERERLFNLPRSQWSDYDPARLSAGGGVFRRDAKTVALTPPMRALLGVEAAIMTPDALIHTLLRLPVDLLWFGGIGTYVKSCRETHAEVGDRANDTLRIDGRDLRCKVVGEGANLAVTQLGRVEYALAGGRINTDAIDNSAGVDTSDHEVNIKILLDEAVRDGDLTSRQRSALLVGMTDEIGELVLRDNYLQTQAISLIESQAADNLDNHERLMRMLEKAGRLNRAVEFLPADDALDERHAHHLGLTRPELAILLAYAKIWLYDAVLASPLPDEAILGDDLEHYFPTALRQRFGQRIHRHRLGREIIATAITNSMVNRTGITLASGLMEKSGMPPEEVARAFLVVRDAYGLRDRWQAIEALDTLVPASVQYAMLAEINRLVDRAATWVLRYGTRPLDVGGTVAELAPGIAALAEILDTVLPEDAGRAIAARADDYVAKGVPAELALAVSRTIVLASAPDIVRIVSRTGWPVADAARLYFAIGTRFGLGWLRAAAESLASDGVAGSHWQKLAAAATIDDFYGHQRDLTLTVIQAGGDRSPDPAIAAWADGRRLEVERADQLLAELRNAGRPDLAILTVANRQLRALTEG